MRPASCRHSALGGARQRGSIRSMTDNPESPFPATRWSLVARVRDRGSQSRPALEELCRLYWRPVFIYARKAGHSREDAEDLTQSFFASLIEKDLIACADESRGRLRTFLLTAFQRFAISTWRRENRMKRGGGAFFTALDDLECTLISDEAPDSAYDRAWAAGLLAEADADLALDYSSRGRGELYKHLRPLLAWNSAPAGAADAVANACGLTSGAVRVALKRLREAWRRRLEHAVAATVSSPDEVTAEVRWLLETGGAAIFEQG